MSASSSRRQFLRRSTAVSLTLPLLSCGRVQGEETDQLVETFTVEYRTRRYAPPATVSVIMTDFEEQRREEYKGRYRTDRWVFVIPLEGFAKGARCEFHLDGEGHDNSSPPSVVPQARRIYEYSCRDCRLTLVDDLALSRTPIEEKLFPVRHARTDFDVIVIGSGMGGGVVADQLADAGFDVAILEAGGLVFPTHVGNLPRSHKVGLFNKHIWDLWYRFGVQDYKKVSPEYVGAQGYNLGGRSIFWGAFIPRMTSWELAEWPSEVRSYLTQEGYDLAEKLAKKNDLDSGYQSEAKRVLKEKFPEFVVSDAPAAIEHTSARMRTLPVGVFSTADLLTESLLTDHSTGKRNLTLRLRHPVVRINSKAGEVTGVTALDLDNDTSREFKAQHYVLAAGAVESAKLAQLSRLQPSNLIGRGITDHPIFYTHFGIPKSGSLYREDEAAKVMLQHPDANASFHPYNILFEFGADLNHGRFVDPDIFAAHQREKDTMLCEVVFLVNARLNEANYVKVLSGKRFGKPTVRVSHTCESRTFREQVEELRAKVLDLFDARVLPNDNLEANLAGAGGVAHEVGSLRMLTEANSRGVVDENLKFLHYNNLYACDLSVFPTSPAANPSLTLIAMALRLGRHISILGT